MLSAGARLSVLILPVELIEQAAGVGAGGAGDFGKIEVFVLRDFLGDEADVFRVIRFAAVRFGSEIRTVGFDQNPIERHGADNFGELFGVFERDRAGKRNMKSHFKEDFGGFARAREAMHHSAAF